MNMQSVKNHFQCPLQVLRAAQMHWLLPHWFHWLQVFHLNWKVKQKLPNCNFAAPLSYHGDYTSDFSWSLNPQKIIDGLRASTEQRLLCCSEPWQVGSQFLTDWLPWRFKHFDWPQGAAPCYCQSIGCSTVLDSGDSGEHFNDCITWNSYHM